MDRKPEIRVLRDTNEEERESVEQTDGGSDEMTPEIISQISPSDDDVFMVDVIEKDDVDPGTKEDSEKEVENLLGKLLEKTIQQQKGDTSSEVVIENIDDLFSNENNNNKNNNENEDEDDEDKINVKEILLGDINYNNNYDTKMPNFYRKHRYDIKKPGPKYYEEYFFNPNADDEVSSSSVEAEADVEAPAVDASSNEPLLLLKVRKRFY